MSGDCPTGVTQFHCLVSPCDGATCEKYPAATCVPNYCGGCNADFYAEGSKLNCTCHEEIQQECYIYPCLFAECDDHPTATCVGNYCGGCYEDYFLNGDKVDC